MNIIIRIESRAPFWLQRLTLYLWATGASVVGSRLCCARHDHSRYMGDQLTTPMGLEPTTFGSEDRRPIRWATAPSQLYLGEKQELKLWAYLHVSGFVASSSSDKLVDIKPSVHARLCGRTILASGNSTVFLRMCLSDLHQTHPMIAQLVEHLTVGDIR